MQQSTTSSADIRRSFEDADRRFTDAFNAGDIDRACELIYTRDARVLPQGGETVQGREQITAFWQATAQQLGIKSIELSTVEVERSGDHAHQIGRATITLADGQALQGKYVVIWKQEDGDWRWDIDIFNFNA